MTYASPSCPGPAAAAARAFNHVGLDIDMTAARGKLDALIESRAGAIAAERAA
jgi:hypothetical protein